MISSLFRASSVLQEENLKETALKCVKTIEKKCFNGTEVFHFFDSKPGRANNLLDYTLLLRTFLDALNYTGQKKFLVSAEKIFKLIEKKFSAPHWGYFDIIDESHSGIVLERKKSLKQNALMAENLITLNSISKDEKFKQKADKIITKLGQTNQNYGLPGAILARAALALEKGIIEVELLGKNDDKTKKFMQKILYNDIGNIVLVILPPKNQNYPKLKICKKNVCLNNISNLNELKWP